MSEPVPIGPSIDLALVGALPVVCELRAIQLKQHTIRVLGIRDAFGAAYERELDGTVALNRETGHMTETDAYAYSIRRLEPYRRDLERELAVRLMAEEMALRECYQLLLEHAARHDWRGRYPA